MSDVQTASDTNEANSISAWTNDQVVAWLNDKGLGALTPAFVEHEVSGLDLVLLSSCELQSFLGLSKVQAMKITKLVEEQGEEADLDVVKAAEGADDEDGEEEAKESDEAANAAAAPLTRGASIVKTTGAVPAATQQPAEPEETHTATPPFAAPAVGIPVGIPAGQPAGAAARSAVVSVSAAVANLTLSVDASTAKRYLDTTALIRELESQQVEALLPGARDKAAALAKRRQAAEQTFQEITTEAEEQGKKLEKLEEGKWYPGKYISKILPGDRHATKLDKERRKVESVEKKKAGAAGALDELCAAHEHAKEVLRDMELMAARLVESRSWCSALLARAFHGYVGNVEEHRLEQEAAAEEPRTQEVRRMKAAYSQAYELLRQARRALEQAVELLNRSLGLARMDVAGNFIRRQPMRPSGPGMMIDVVKRSQMRQGFQLCKVAADLALKAHAIIPSMPRMEVEKVKFLRAGLGIMDIAFDNIVSDMIAMRKIRNGLNTANQVLGDVKAAERWVEGWLKGRIEADLAASEARFAALRKALHERRAELMAAWAQQRVATAGATTPAMTTATVGGGGPASIVTPPQQFLI